MGVALLLGFGILGASSPALGASPSALVNTGIKRYQALDYQGAIQILNQALRNRQLDRGNRLRALAHLGRAHAVLNQPGRATRRFTDLLRLEPTFQVDWQESPRIREAFAAAESVIRSEQPTTPSLAPPEPVASAGSAILPTGAGGQDRSRRGPRRVAPVIPPNVEEPLKTTETVETPTPWWQRWYVWAGAAAVIAGGVTTAIVLSNQEDRPNVDVIGEWNLP